MAHVSMLPRLEAEDALHLATIGGVSRAMKPGAWVRRQLSQWRTTARPSGTLAPSLSDVGIGVRVVKRG